MLPCPGRGRLSRSESQGRESQTHVDKAGRSFGTNFSEGQVELWNADYEAKQGLQNSIVEEYLENANRQAKCKPRLRTLDGAFGRGFSLALVGVELLLDGSLCAAYFAMGIRNELGMASLTLGKHRDILNPLHNTQGTLRHVLILHRIRWFAGVHSDSPRIFPDNPHHGNRYRNCGTIRDRKLSHDRVRRQRWN